MTILRWPIETALTLGDDYRGNQLLAQNISSKGYEAIIAQYVYVTPGDIKNIFSCIPGAWDAFCGKGIDLGGGVACISSTIGTRPEVESIHCVELTEDVVTLCHPIVTDAILKNSKSKVISVVGDFNCLESKSDSMDFAVAWGSLHHSYQLRNTLIECRRVLKPNAHLVVVERAHNNYTPESEIDRMLNVKYDEDFLRKTYRDPNMTLSRRDNGEHEYRYQEWSHAFSAAGFHMVNAVVIRDQSGKNKVTTNDAGLPEVFIDSKLGGYLSSKAGYVLEANK